MPVIRVSVVLALAGLVAQGAAQSAPESEPGSEHDAERAISDLLPEGEHDLDPIGTGDTAPLANLPPPPGEPPDDPTLGPIPVDA